MQNHFISILPTVPTKSVGIVFLMFRSVLLGLLRCVRCFFLMSELLVQLMCDEIITIWLNTHQSKQSAPIWNRNKWEICCRKIEIALFIHLKWIVGYIYDDTRNNLNNSAVINSCECAAMFYFQRIQKRAKKSALFYSVWVEYSIVWLRSCLIIITGIS